MSRELANTIERRRVGETDRAERAEARYDALLDKYHSLKLQGANPSPASQSVIAKELSPVDWAIQEKAGSNHRLRLYLTGWAAKQSAANVEPEQIIDRISNWHDESDD